MIVKRYRAFVYTAIQMKLLLLLLLLLLLRVRCTMIRFKTVRCTMLYATETTERECLRTVKRESLILAH